MTALNSPWDLHLKLPPTVDHPIATQVRRQLDCDQDLLLETVSACFQLHKYLERNDLLWVLPQLLITDVGTKQQGSWGPFLFSF